MFGNMIDIMGKVQRAEVLLNAIFTLLKIVASQNASSPQEHARIAQIDQQVQNNEVA